MSREGTLRLGSSLLALGCLGLFTAPLIILAAGVDPSTRAGRHLIAGALGLAGLSVLEAVIALGPLRRGEPWAWWAALTPFLIVGVPVLIMDAVFVPGERVLATIAPQATGLLVGGLGLALCAWSLATLPNGVPPAGRSSRPGER